MWAFPDGIKIYDHNLQIINDKEPEFSFGEAQRVSSPGDENNEKPADFTYSFVHTDYSLNRTFFSALCFHVRPVR